MCHGREQIGHIYQCTALILYLRKHHFIGMSVYKADTHLVCKGTGSQLPVFGKRFAGNRDELQAAAFFYGKDILFEERSFLPVVRLGGPLPMLFVAPVNGISECRHELAALSFNTAPTMIEMQV